MSFISDDRGYYLQIYLFLYFLWKFTNYIWIKDSSTLNYNTTKKWSLLVNFLISNNIFLFQLTQTMLWRNSCFFSWTNFLCLLKLFFIFNSLLDLHELVLSRFKSLNQHVAMFCKLSDIKSITGLSLWYAVRHDYGKPAAKFKKAILGLLTEHWWSCFIKPAFQKRNNLYNVGPFYHTLINNILTFNPPCWAEE